MDLDKALADYKGAYLSYPQVRRDVEFNLMAALVDEVKALKAVARDVRDGIPQLAAEASGVRERRGPGRPPKGSTAMEDGA